MTGQIPPYSSFDEVADRWDMYESPPGSVCDDYLNCQESGHTLGDGVITHIFTAWKLLPPEAAPPPDSSWVRTAPVRGYVGRHRR